MPKAIVVISGDGGEHQVRCLEIVDCRAGNVGFLTIGFSGTRSSQCRGATLRVTDEKPRLSWLQRSHGRSLV